MFNYASLSDVEFEDLCKDIMERKLNTTLKVFGKGRDGGIDLTDDVKTNNIVVQVKHYINSGFSNLKSSLSKEVVKIISINPNKYFVCCSMDLTPKNTLEIFNLFSKFMETDKNIVALKEIDEFLQKPENIDIVRKNFKLWLHSTSILSDLLNNDVFIDCETLLKDIEDDCKYFVQTSAYEKCLDSLEKNRVIMMIGAPGVGKTITSKMLVLNFVEKGYRVRYSTNGDISDIKSSISANSEKEEIVLLDDCLGQHYFRMRDTQESELLSLIKYIKIHPKKALILNSRITIYNEAKERTEVFKFYLEGKEVQIHKINIDEISGIEKAKIFYNHLYFRDIPREYFDDIKRDKRYLEIVNHKNYMPRIIDYVTNSQRYLNIPAHEYGDFILKALSRPDDIWKDEFDHRLSIIDRVFMHTLYSLTDTIVDSNVLKKCFNKRIENINEIDNTINNYNSVLTRLNGSVVSIFDNKGKKQVGVINPSVNDYLKPAIQENTLELANIQKSIVNFNQLSRCYNSSELSVIYQQLISTGEILSLDFDDNRQKTYFIISRICNQKIQNECYAGIIETFFSLKNEFVIGFGSHEKPHILFSLGKEPLFSFYNIYELAVKFGCEMIFYENTELDVLAETIFEIYNIFNKRSEDCQIITKFISVCVKSIYEALSWYEDCDDISEFLKGLNISDIVNHNTYPGSDYVYEFDEIGAISEIKTFVEIRIDESISDFISRLPKEISKLVTFETFSIHVSEIEISDVIDEYFKDGRDFGTEDNYGHGQPVDNAAIIDTIFDRDYHA